MAFLVGEKELALEWVAEMLFSIESGEQSENVRSTPVETVKGGEVYLYRSPTPGFKDHLLDGHKDLHGHDTFQ